MLISRPVALVRGVAMLVAGPHAVSGRTATAGVAYRLKAGAHCSCKACERHAANKLFATRAAAQRGRAHAGCRCTIVQVRGVKAAQWEALFGHPHKLSHTVVDRRWASTKRALRRASTARATRASRAIKRHR